MLEKNMLEWRVTYVIFGRISFKRSAAVKDYSALNKKMKLKGGIGEIIGAVVQSCNLTSIYLKIFGP